jgi:hypothetical protein
MDNTAFHELIAQVRSTAAELDQAEQKVAAFKAELAQQEHGAQCGFALQRAIEPLPKRVSSGWLPTTDTPSRPMTRPVTRRGSAKAKVV